MKPTPKRPVLPTCVRLTESPMREIDSKSLSLNVESLNTSSDGPWNCARPSYASVSVPCERSSRHTFTVLAPASSWGFGKGRRGRIVEDWAPC